MNATSERKNDLYCGLAQQVRYLQRLEDGLMVLDADIYL